MSYLSIIGLMSGTSFDGIDLSYIYSDGNTFERTGINSITPYQNQTKNLIKIALVNPIKFLKNKKKLSLLNRLITLDHVDAVKKFIIKNKISPKLIGFHGQTILHNPRDRKSYQLGDGQLLSELLKLDVVYNFRSNDLKFGGEGAPISPIYHKYILENLKVGFPAIIVNIGGICNLTYLDRGSLIGFDTGPGNNLMDYFMKNKFNLDYDNAGIFASKGTINSKLIDKYTRDFFFSRPPPKSLDRKELFNNKTLKAIYLLNSYDCLATLCALTCKTLEMGVELLPKKPKTTILVGGGQKNKFLVSLIKKTNISNLIYTGEQVGLDSNFIESELIAFLAARKIYNFPSTFPSTTGVQQETVLGELIEYKD